MRDRVFLDTNVVIYFYSEDEPQKQMIANDNLERYSDRIIISTQVINELSNTLFRKFKLSTDKVRHATQSSDRRDRLTIINPFRIYFPTLSFRTYTDSRFLFAQNVWY